MFCVWLLRALPCFWGPFFYFLFPSLVFLRKRHPEVPFWVSLISFCLLGVSFLRFCPTSLVFLSLSPFPLLSESNILIYIYIYEYFSEANIYSEYYLELPVVHKTLPSIEPKNLIPFLFYGVSEINNIV